MKQDDPHIVTQVERETWNRAAATYIDSAAELTKHALPILLDACRLTRGSRAIDIACGPGHVTNMVAQTGASVVGVDLAPEMIKLARQRYPALTFQEAHVEQLPFDTDTFDAALVNFAIHHFARPEIACAEIRRVLKPGGRFVFAGPIQQCGFGAFIEGINAHHTLDDLPHGPIYLDADQAVYEALMRNSGFDEFKIDVRELPLHLESLEPLLVAGWVICNLSGLPQETQDKIAATTREKAAPYKTARGYEFPDRVVIGVAVKG
jgi:SAM-dependent methyltransferase